jgi:hypothetical protein
MTMPRRAHRRQVFSSVRRRTAWATFGLDFVLDSPGTFITADMLGDFKSDLGVTQGCTVARTHMRVSVATAPEAEDSFYLGMIVEPHTNLGVDIAGAPDPQTSPYVDWMWWDHRVASAGSTLVGTFEGDSNNWSYDIKSKRKIEQVQEVLALVVINDVTSGTTMTVHCTGRVLLMLP